MSEQPAFQPPNDDPNYASEAKQALDKERQLPLTGWQQEVDQGLKYGLEAAESIKRPYYFNFFTGGIASLCRN